ncbi:MAG: hypothetical protein EAX96_18480 [Candidatus Lokiarchaeota archaeon]|nr:hypothetical protein [Candidatus Lokiarchaeota archaeon]
MSPMETELIGLLVLIFLSIGYYIIYFWKFIKNAYFPSIEENDLMTQSEKERKLTKKKITFFILPSPFIFTFTLLILFNQLDLTSIFAMATIFSQLVIFIVNDFYLEPFFRRAFIIPFIFSIFFIILSVIGISYIFIFMAELLYSIWDLEFSIIWLFTGILVILPSTYLTGWFWDKAEKAYFKKQVKNGGKLIASLYTLIFGILIFFFGFLNFLVLLGIVEFKSGRPLIFNMVPFIEILSWILLLGGCLIISCSILFFIKIRKARKNILGW